MILSGAAEDARNAKRKMNNGPVTEASESVWLFGCRLL